MSLKKFRRLGPTAAWRISIWTTAAFAFGTAVAFAIMYMLVARGIHERSDAWLTGELKVLSEVSANTPRDSLYDRLMEEVAEQAAQELPDTGARGDRYQNSVFFLLMRPRQEPLWVGPANQQPFLRELNEVALSPGIPATMTVPGYTVPFRVAYHFTPGQGRIFLGFADTVVHRFLNRLIRRFLAIWFFMGALGFLISFFAAHRTLSRVERITRTAARIGSEDLTQRVFEGPDNDEVSRLAATFNHMLDRIQASVRQLRAVTESVAHDLKSPVTSIRGSLEVALTEKDDGWQEMVAVAIEKLDRLLQTLDTTLDLAEAGAGALQLRREPVNLSQLVSQLVASTDPEASPTRATWFCCTALSRRVTVSAPAVLVTVSQLRSRSANPGNNGSAWSNRNPVMRVIRATHTWSDAMGVTYICPKSPQCTSTNFDHGSTR